MPASFDPATALRAAAAAREAAGLTRELRPREANGGAVTDLASNDYLGLATEPRVTAAAAAAAREWGAGATASRLVTGSTTLHATLERELAAFTGAASALVFSSGYLANLAAVTALAAALAAGVRTTSWDRAPGERPGPATRDGLLAVDEPSSVTPAGRAGAVLVLSDEMNHASLVDACRLARARVEIYPHLDTAAVTRALATRAEPAALVVTESAFSAGGPSAPLPALHAAAREHGALLVVDEAHALGVSGPGGRGAACAAGVGGDPGVVRTVTLSKALGTQGGAVLGSDEVIATLVSTGRGFIFDTALAPPATAAALAALRILAACPSLAGEVQANARRLTAIAAGAGLAVAGTHADGKPTPMVENAVVRITLGDARLAVAARDLCADHGVLVGCFRPPAVQAGQSCLRLTARADLTETDFGAASAALHAVAAMIQTPA